MKLPVIRHIHKHNTAEEIESTIKVLESISESASMKPEEIDVIGEMISNLCGALEVIQMMNNGMPEKDAANTFMKKVIGSIDK